MEEIYKKKFKKNHRNEMNIWHPNGKRNPFSGGKKWGIYIPQLGPPTLACHDIVMVDQI